MKPDTHTVKQLFERDVRYQVPLYQRPYVWTEDEQWEPLWSDIEGLLRHQEGGGDSDLWVHFLGAIVLEQERTGPGRIPRYTVIDGQQRLTTLQLLIAGVARATMEAGAHRDAKILRRLVENDPLEAKEDELLKVWPTNANRASFAAVMKPDGPPPEHVNDTANLVDEAFEFFVSRAGDYLNGSNGEEPADPDAVASRATLLRVTLSDLIKIVSITLERDDNAQVIFETLNARGTPLLSLDLVKNAVFRQISTQGQDADVLYETVWRPQLDDEYWRTQRRQGRLSRPAGELFLMHWLTMRLERVIPATELFASFRQGVLADDIHAEPVIRELCRDADVMRSFDSLDPNSPEGQFFARFGSLDAGTVLPIVLLLFRSPEVTVERRRRALSMLESWLARRALMRLTSKDYNRLVPRLIARMKTDLGRADDVLHATLVGGEGAVSRWPNDEEFSEFLATREVYGVVSRPRLVMALAAVENSLRTSKTEALVDGRNLSLEHLLPQEWETNWPINSGADADQDAFEKAKDARRSALHRIGNLTLAASALNSAMTNAPWSDKRTELNRHSVLLLNSQLAKHETWDEQAIEERGAWLARQLIEIWPGPYAAEWC